MQTVRAIESWNHAACMKYAVLPSIQGTLADVVHNFVQDAQESAHITSKEKKNRLWSTEMSTKQWRQAK